jgi:hypothetical protein
MVEHNEIGKTAITSNISLRQDSIQILLAMLVQVFYLFGSGVP